MDALQGLVMGSSWAGLPPAGKLFLVIGAAMGARVALSTLRWVYAFFLRPAINVKKLGAWGVVTVLSAPAPAPAPHRSKKKHLLRAQTQRHRSRYFRRGCLAALCGGEGNKCWERSKLVVCSVVQAMVGPDSAGP